jgi:hypothetical protein
LFTVKIIDYFYYNNKSNDEKFNAPVLVLVCRDEKNEPHFVKILDKENLAPYFGVLKEDAEVMLIKEKEEYGKWGRNIVDVRDNAPPSLYDEEVYHVYTTFPYEVNMVKKRFLRTFVADVKWEKMAISKIINKCGLEGPYIKVPIDYYYKFLKVSDIEAVEKRNFFKIRERICFWDIETD